MGGPIKAFCNRRETNSEWWHHQSPAETWWKPSVIPESHISAWKKIPETLDREYTAESTYSSCMLTSGWEWEETTSIVTYLPTAHPPPAPLSWLSACRGSQFGIHDLKTVTEFNKKAIGETIEIIQQRLIISKNYCQLPKKKIMGFYLFFSVRKPRKVLTENNYSFLNLGMQWI